MKIEEAIKQTTFNSNAQKAAINIMYSSSWLSHHMRNVLHPFGLSWQQFNVMRIIRGQKGKPVALKVLTERMIDKTSNTSRLIDKLVDKNFAQRVVCPNDRRKVEITLTSQGEEILIRSSREMDEMVKEFLGHMDEENLALLNQLLDQLRN